jgi:hypothetical protein
MHGGESNLPHIEALVAAYGAEGTDDCWFAGADEIYWYLAQKASATFRTEVADGKLNIYVNGLLENTVWQDLTLNVTGLGEADPTTLIIGKQMVNVTSKKISGGLMINFNASRYLLDCINTYREKYQKKITDTYGDAQNLIDYWTQQLKPTLH